MGRSLNHQIQQSAFTKYDWLISGTNLIWQMCNLTQGQTAQEWGLWTLYTISTAFQGLLIEKFLTWHTGLSPQVFLLGVKICPYKNSFYVGILIEH